MNKKQILVIDDDQIARMLILKVLQMRDYEAFALEDSKKALETLHQKKWDLLILDINLSGIKGTEVIKQAREMDENLKIVILTSHGTLDTAIQAIHYKVYDYMLKPALPRDILKSLDEALREPECIKISVNNKVPIRATIEPVGVINIDNKYFYDSSKRRVRAGTQVVNLTQTENTIFAYLAEFKNRVVSHEELVEYAYGYKLTKVEAAKMLRPVISRIRTKFFDFGPKEEIIQNVRGKGYLVESSAEDAG